MTWRGPGGSHGRMRPTPSSVKAASMITSTRYEFRLAERLSATPVSAFPELTVNETRSGTVLFGPVRDRSELYGFLDRFAVMGLTVLEIHRLPD